MLQLFSTLALLSTVIMFAFWVKIHLRQMHNENTTTLGLARDMIKRQGDAEVKIEQVAINVTTNGDKLFVDDERIAANNTMHNALVLEVAGLRARVKQMQRAEKEDKKKIKRKVTL